MVALCQGAKRIAGVVLVAVQPESPFTNQLSVNLMNLDVTSELYESLKVEVIVLGSFLGATTLNLDMFDKITDEIR